jgi:hypothetical protein
MSIRKLPLQLLATTNASQGDILVYSAANSTVEFGMSTDNNSWVNSNDYATYSVVTANIYDTYTSVASLINTVQANLTSVIGSAPATLDTLAEIAAALENDANIAVTLTTQISNSEARRESNLFYSYNGHTVTSTANIVPSTNNTISLGGPGAVWKDIYVGPGTIYVGDLELASTAEGLSITSVSTATTTTLDTTFPNISTAINLVQANLTTEVGVAAANDYNTYTTVNGLINTVDGRVTTEAGIAAANDYNTYTTVNGLINTVDGRVTTEAGVAAANDYATYTTLTTNTYNTYTTLSGLIDSISSNISSDTSSAANDYVTYTTLSGLINSVQANLTSIIDSAPGTLDTLAEIAAALENDANIAVTLSSQISGIAVTSAANDYNTYTTVTGLINTEAGVAAANDYNTYTTVNGLITTVDGRVTTEAGVAAANDYNTYNTVIGLINTVSADLVAADNNAWVNANDYATYTTITGLLNGVQDNVTSLTSTVDSIDANVYTTYTNLIGLLDIVQNNVESSSNAAAAVYNDNFTITTSNTFILSHSADDSSKLVVTLDGLVQTPDINYIVNNTTLTLANTLPLPAGLSVGVRHIGGTIRTAAADIWATVTANATLAADNHYFVDSSASTITLTLPAASYGKKVKIIDAVGKANVNAITITGAGAKIMGVADDLSVSTYRAALTLVYFDEANGWLLGEV